MVPAGLWVMVKYKYSIKGYTLLQTFYVDQVDFSTALVIILAQLFSPVFNIEQSLNACNPGSVSLLHA